MDEHPADRLCRQERPEEDLHLGEQWIVDGMKEEREPTPATDEPAKPCRRDAQEWRNGRGRLLHRLDPGPWSGL